MDLQESSAQSAWFMLMISLCYSLGSFGDCWVANSTQPTYL